MSDTLTPEKPAAAPVAQVVNVAVMNQLAADSSQAESPLFHADLASMAKQGPKQGGVILQELKLLGHLVLRGNVEDRAFTDAAEKVMGAPLPGPLQTSVNGELSIRWISPDEWLVVVPGERAFELENELRAAMQGHFAIVNASGGQTILRLSGAKAREVLMKSTPYDVHDSQFPVGKVVTSVFAKTQAVISRTGVDSWELVIRRSFADYAWLWLQDACAEFGLVVKD